MNRHGDLLRLERAGWRALATSGDAAAEFYDSVLANEVVMLLPGGLVIDDRAQVIESMRGAPWASYELVDERVLDLTRDSAIVTYRGRAQRVGNDYHALFNSTYVREGGVWKLKVHQQTPI
jgi:hypothetical protein